MQKIYFLLATLIAIFFNTLAIVLPLGGRSTKEISDNIYPTLITPAGYVFSIWSVIYLGLIALGIAILTKRITIPQRTLNLYLIASACNIFWIITWHYLIPVLPAILLFSLMFLNFLIAKSLKGFPQHFYLIYYSWTVLASLINAVVLFKYELKLPTFGIPAEYISALLLLIGYMVLVLSSLKFHSSIPLVVALWGFYGIHVGQSNEIIKSTAYALTLFCFLGIIERILINRKIIKDESLNNSFAATGGGGCGGEG